jgi:hypothetical protein
MTWLIFMAGWLIAATVLGFTLGRAIREMDMREAEYRRRMDEVEMKRREQFRRAMEDGS